MSKEMKMDNALEYTREFDVDSSVIDEVYFNENDGTVVLDVNDILYLYSNVNIDDVSALVEADSVGAYYNQVFKDAHGPSEKLGYYTEFEPVKVHSIVSSLVNGLVNISTGATEEFSLQAPAPTVTAPVYDHSVSGSPVATKEYSLALIESDKDERVEVEQENVRSVVHFTLKGNKSKTYKFYSNAITVDSAIDEVDAYVSRLGQVGNVKKVVFKFA